MSVTPQGCNSDNSLEMFLGTGRGKDPTAGNVLIDLTKKSLAAHSLCGWSGIVIHPSI